MCIYIKCVVQVISHYLVKQRDVKRAANVHQLNLYSILCQILSLCLGLTLCDVHSKWTYATQPQLAINKSPTFVAHKCMHLFHVLHMHGCT